MELKEIKYTCWHKNLVLRSQGRLDTVGKGISGLENRCKEITQNSGKKERGLKT